ncbi:MAG TPA: hypothetical protein VFX51_20005 [Solirubrobacteraceae bacterium]|nr:hypothetical protein [Solirubrobacteraceae bacterium]
MFLNRPALATAYGSAAARPRRRLALPRRRSPGALLGRSRAGVALLLLLAVANGAFLYLLPARAEPDYAWAIVPPINAAFLGAGYIAGTVATALVVFATRSWRSLRMLPLPLVVLAVGLLAATLVHADKFRWDYPLTWIWTGVYAGVPFVVAYLWRRQERDAPPAPPAHPGLRPLRIASAVIGGLVLAGSAALYIAPMAVGELWPWPLTALLGRAVASWYALIGTALVVCAWSMRRPSEALIPYATLLAWSLLLLALPLLHAGDLGGGPLAPWVALQVVLVAVAAYALATALPLARAANERL